MIKEYSHYIALVSIIGVVILGLLVLVGGKSQPVQSIKDFGSRTVGSWRALSLTTDTNLTITNGETIDNSVSHRRVQANITSTTTVPCLVQNPFSATSTFSHTAINITTATSVATVIDLFIQAPENRFATTGATSLVSNSIAANLLGNVSLGIADNENVIGGSKYLVFGYQTATDNGGGAVGAANAALQQGGTCGSEFSEI